MKQALENPWLGLRSYPEGITLYGRNNEILELSQKIIYNTQTIVYGRSGIGKSSLIKAGIFPILRRHNFFPVYIRLVHNEDHDSYTQQIITAVEASLKRLRIEDLSADVDAMYRFIEGCKEEIVPAFCPDKEENLWEYFHRHKFYYVDEKDERHYIMPVMIFDQFEEIFTLQKDSEKTKNFFNEFANLANNTCPKELLIPTVDTTPTGTYTPTGSSLIKKGIVRKAVKLDYIDESNFHFVISIREDFLSHLERNVSHIPSLKHNRYCLLPLSEDQAAEIIMQPVPGLISKEVAKEIICKVTDAPYDSFEIDNNPELEVDSAILSLFLSELYKKKEPDSHTITRQQVAQLGSNIISDFYHEITSQPEVSESTIHYFEQKLITDDERRDAIYYEQAIRYGITENEIEYLLQQRILHKYPWRDGIRIEFSHDILCPIIVKRRNERKAEQEKIKQQELLIQAQAERRRLIRIIFSLILAILLAIGIYIDGWVDVKVEYYADTIKRNSWVEGRIKLSREEASYLSHSYWFYRKGRWADHAYMFEARDGYGKLTPKHNMVTYLSNQYDDDDRNANNEMKEALKTIVRWELISDNTGDFCIQEKAFDKDNNLIYCYNNARMDNNQIVSNYTDNLGFPIILRDSCYIFLRTTLDKKGHEILLQFYDDNGYPITNRDSAFMTQKFYFDNGLQESEASLFISGKPMIDKVGNCGWKILDRTPDNQHYTLVIYFDNNILPCRTSEGVMLKKYEYDQYDRVLSESYWQINDTMSDIYAISQLYECGLLELHPDTNKNGVHKFVLEYNRHGLITKQENYNIDNEPKAVGGYISFTSCYDSHGNTISEKAFAEGNTLFYVDSCIYDDQDKCIYEDLYNLTDTQDTLWRQKIYTDPITSHKIKKIYYNDDTYLYGEYDSKGNLITDAWYTTSNNQPTLYNGIHKTINKYDYVDNTNTIITTTYHDTNNNNIGDYQKEVCYIDSTKYTKDFIKYRLDKNLYGDTTERYIVEEAYRNIFRDNKFDLKIAEASIDSDRRIVRNYNNQAYYYILKLITSIKTIANDGHHIGYYAVNEFNEPSLARYYGVSFHAMYKNKPYIESGEVGNCDEDRQPMLCDLDTEYPDPKRRIRKGDILVAMDDWTFWSYKEIPYFAFYDLNLTPEVDKEHNIKVLRFNETTNEYDLVEIYIPANDEITSHLTFKKHFCTKQEEDRIKKILGKYIYNNCFMITPIKDSAIYQQGMTTRQVLLAINEWDMRQDFDGKTDSIMNIIRNYDGATKHVIAIDPNTDKIYEYKVDTIEIENLESYSIEPSYFNAILQQLQSLQEQQ